MLNGRIKWINQMDTYCHYICDGERPGW
jgi:hypothetical protein